MKKFLMRIVKYIKPMYDIYYYTLNFFIKLLGVFIIQDDKLILFNSFGGKKYDDSPKVLYEAMLKDERFKEFHFVWAFHEPERFVDINTDTVKTDTIKYFITALKARCWITNSGMERGLNFKRNETFYFNTWHGTPIKKMGSDIGGSSRSFKSKAALKVDAMTAQGEYEADIFSRVFNIHRSKFVMSGLPRNDILTQYTEDEKNKIKKRLSLPENKKVILYAPTFREYDRDKQFNCTLKLPIDIDKWKNELSDNYCILFRVHYEISSYMNIKNDDFIIDVSNYPVLDDLMIAADILISDYSSIFFDFSIMDKVMLYFTYDYEEYEAKRGLYFDIRNYISGGKNEDEIIELLNNIDENEKLKSKTFRDAFVNYYGNATQKSLDYIISNIGD